MAESGVKGEMLVPVRSPNFARNEARVGPHSPCFLCGKAVLDRSRWLHVVADRIVTDEEAGALIAEHGSGADLGFYPVGPECARRAEVRIYVQRITEGIA